MTATTFAATALRSHDRRKAIEKQTPTSGELTDAFEQEFLTVAQLLPVDIRHGWRGSIGDRAFRVLSRSDNPSLLALEEIAEGGVA